MSFKDNFTDKFMEISGRIGSQRHLVAIRDSFIAAMPITMAGSIAVLLNVFLRDLPTSLGWDSFAAAVAPIVEINGYVNAGTIGVMAMFFAFSLGSNLSESYGVNSLAGGLISFASFIVVIPQSLNITTELTGVDNTIIQALIQSGFNITEADGVSSLATSGSGLSLGYLGATGLFSALIIGMVSTMIYSYLMRKKITIKLPDSVPPAVSKAFAAIIPGTVAIYVSAIIGFIALQLTGLSLNDLISQYIQLPLMGLSQGIGSVILLTFLVQLLWFFGLHGHNVLAPIMDGVYGAALNENTVVYEATRDIAQLPWEWTRGSFDAYAQMGGSGATLGLIIAILWLSKREEHRTIAKLSAPMGVFNINEPVIFGMPIVLNPQFAIPWLITPPILVTIAYLATSWGLVPPVFLAVPWITPPGIYAFLATGGSIAAGILALFNMFISFLIYVPFVLAANKVKVEDAGDFEVAE